MLRTINGINDTDTKCVRHTLTSVWGWRDENAIHTYYGHEGRDWRDGGIHLEDALEDSRMSTCKCIYIYIYIKAPLCVVESVRHW